MLLGSLFHGSNLLWDFDSFFLEDRVALGSGFFYPWLKDQQLVLLSNFRSERQAACAHVITPQWRDDKLGNESMSLSASEASKRAFFQKASSYNKAWLMFPQCLLSARRHVKCSPYTISFSPHRRLIITVLNPSYS